MTRGEAAGGDALPGYVEVGSAFGEWLSRPDCAAALATGDLDDLLADAGPHRPAAGGGRRPLVPLRLGGQEALAKRPVHGGLLGRLCGGLYWGRGRIVAQVRAAGRLRAGGVMTPDVLAAGWRRVAGPLQRHAIISSAIPGAMNLHDASRNRPHGLSRRSILVAAALAVRRMHDVRFLHADLNVTNLVLEPRPDDPVVHIVDLDRGRFRAVLDLADRARNLARLLRSYEKWLAAEAPLSDREELLFLRSYARGDRAMLRWLLQYLIRYRKSLGARRLSWRLRQGNPTPSRTIDRSR